MWNPELGHNGREPAAGQFGFHVPLTGRDALLRVPAIGCVPLVLVGDTQNGTGPSSPEMAQCTIARR